jgi:hypothetical protein
MALMIKPSPRLGYTNIEFSDLIVVYGDPGRAVIGSGRVMEHRRMAPAIDDRKKSRAEHR